MYHPTTRVLTVLELLQLHRRMTGTELAQRVGVTARTLRRYITMLQELGIPIMAERGRYGAYELIPGFKLPPMMFTNDEALALAVGLLATQHLGLTEMEHTIESTRAKLERVMPAELKERVRALTDTILLNVDTSPATSSTAIMLTLSSAAKLQRRVHMRYRSDQDEETERDLDPYGLAHHRGKWYVVGHCSLRNDLRLFRVDRILEVESTSALFERPPHFDTLTYLMQKIATLPRQFAFEILLKTDLDAAEDEVMPTLGILELSEDGVLVRGSTDDLDWLARQLARLPFDFEVHQPEGLRLALQNLAAKLASLV